VDFLPNGPVAAAKNGMNPPSSKSTTVDRDLQQQLEWREAINAEQRAQVMRQVLRRYRRESCTEYGTALFQQFADPVSREIEAILYRWQENPQMGGPGYGALPLVAALGSPQRIAAVALVTILDRLSHAVTFQGLALTIGLAVDAEVKAGEIEKRAPASLERLLNRTTAEKRKAVLAIAARPIEGADPIWSRQERATVGLLLLEVVRGETGLVIIDKSSQPNRRRQWRVLPSAKALDFIRRHPPRSLRPNRGPMVIEPIPWKGLVGGGHLANTSPVVQVRAARDHAAISYLSGRIKPQLAAVNILQRQQLEVDPWMLRVQREAWDRGIPGLFPVERDPAPDAGPFPVSEPPDVQDAWRRNQARHHQDLRDNSSKRLAIERALQTAEALVGRPIYQAHFLDFRGRAFTANRGLTHQGPDHQKALLRFGPSPRVGHKELNWVLKAAAGHWGLTRSEWSARMDWGVKEMWRLETIAYDPIGNADLWREAKQPWQFLQMARAWSEPGEGCRVPIRLDQTCSGAGIIATLLRDQAMAKLCNICGTGLNDLYSAVVERLRHQLEIDLHCGDTRTHQLAAGWLDLGIDRSWVKSAVMHTPFGSTSRTVADGIRDRLQQRLGPVDDWAGRIYRPSNYLESRLRVVLGTETSSLMQLRRWLCDVGRLVVGRHQQQIRWTTPMGWPMQVGRPTPSKSVIRTHLLGKLASVTFDEDPPDGELSARKTNASITANLVHSFDAALVHAVACRAGAQGAPLLTNHDCFATDPANASWLQKTLLDEFRALYAADWLEVIAEEIRCNAGLEALPPPPPRGALEIGEIGNNPYLFS
jgi:DNA-directed RNA polymerase